MKAKVNKETCVGCGLCEGTCSTVFEMDGDIAKVIADPVPESAQEDCRQAAEDCPVDAIALEE